MKKKWLTVGIPVGVIIVAIILLAFSGSSASLTELVKSFEETIKNDDAKGLVNLVKVDEGIIWSEAYAASIIEHLQNNKTDFEEQLKILIAQATYYESDGQTNNTLFQMYPAANILEIGPFYIAEEEGLLGNNYTLKARGYQLSVEAPEGTSLTINGEEIETDHENTKTLGVFAPGVYVIEGSKDYDHTTVTDEREVTLFDMEEFSEIVRLNMSGQTIIVNSNTPKTELYVNDHPAELMIDKETQFGPVKEGMILKGVAKFPWGTGESVPITVEGEANTYDLTPRPVTSKEIKNQIAEIINEFAQNRIAALVEQDTELLNNVSDNIKKDYKRRVGTFDDRHYVIGRALGTRIDFSHITYEHGSGSVNMIHIPVEFYDEFVEVFRISRNIDLQERFEERIVTIEYDENNHNKWVITKIRNDSNAKINDNYMTSDEVVKTTF